MWLKLSDDHGDDCARANLSDAAFRTHTEGLLWTMRRENGGLIDSLDVRRFGESPDAAVAVDELVVAGFWVVTDDGWQIVHAMEHQPEPEVITKRKGDAASRQRRKRAKSAGLDVTRDDPRDSNSDDPRDPGRDGPGRAGAGRDGQGREETLVRARAEGPQTAASSELAAAPDPWGPTLFDPNACSEFLPGDAVCHAPATEVFNDRPYCKRHREERDAAKSSRQRAG